MARYKVIIIDKEHGEEDEIFDNESDAQLYWMSLHEDYNSANLKVEVIED